VVKLLEGRTEKFVAEVENFLFAGTYRRVLGSPQPPNRAVYPVVKLSGHPTNRVFVMERLKVDSYYTAWYDTTLQNVLA
jgi:hypothetical protein